MEDQGKRLLLACAVAFAIMIGWSFLFPPDPPRKETPTDKVAGPTPDGTPIPQGGPSAPAPAAVPTAPAARGAEQTVELTSPSFRAVFSTYGGALKSWQLLGEQFYHREPSTPEDLVRGKGEAAWPFQISFPSSTLSLPPGAEWQLLAQTADSVTFGLTAGALEVKKTFKIYPADYLVELTVDVKAASAAKQNLLVSLGSFQDPREIKEGSFTSGIGREWKAACYANDQLSEWAVRDLPGKTKEVGGQVKWFGFVYPYFMTAVAIEPREERVTCRALGPRPEAGEMLVEAQLQTVDLAAGASYQRKFAGYFGPRYKDKLEAVGAVLSWPAVGFEKAIDLGWFAFLAGPLLWLLVFFHGLVGSWPLSIVLLTVTVKLLTLYPTHKSMKSMKSMAKLRPDMERIKEKYKDDRQRQQAETMALFKEHGVNPMAGCLPILLQMPIWFALYKALSVAAELYQAPFLWISDLTSNDPYFILPVFMTVMMLVQSLLQPTTATGAQQKMLTYGMPLIFGGMSLFFPAGLTLYISTNSILTLLHHLYMRAEDRKVTTPATGGGARPVGGGPVIDVVDRSDEESARAGEPRNGAGGKRKSKKRSGRRRGAHS